MLLLVSLNAPYNLVRLMNENRPVYQQCTVWAEKYGIYKSNASQTNVKLKPRKTKRFLNLGLTNTQYCVVSYVCLFFVASGQLLFTKTEASTDHTLYGQKYF